MIIVPKHESQLNKLREAKTFPWKELVTLLGKLGYELRERSGSRVVFQDVADQSNRIHLHKPHPENYLKGGALNFIFHKRGSYEFLQLQRLHGHHRADLESNTLFGKLFGIRQLVTYEADTMPELKQAFEDSVDDYLAYCEEEGITPDKPCKGSFSVRVGSELHALALAKAQSMNTNLNNFVKTAIQEKLAHP